MPLNRDAIDPPRSLHPQLRQFETAAAHNTRLARLERSAPESLHFVGATGEPTFSNSWVHYDANSATPNFSAATYRNVGFYRDRGRVYLQGVLKSGTVGTTAFTLPAGYRPLNQRGFIVLTNGTTGYITVESTGAVTMASVSNAYVFLDAVDFRV